ncbi:MAG: hypothetical protein QM662_14660 [Gordonia sp. (in: high G+C Gram-positive bacteria)]
MTAVLGFLLIVFSCLSWISVDDDDATASVSGLGSASVSLEETSAITDVDRQEKIVEREIENDTSAPGGATLAMGVILMVGGVALVVGYYPVPVALVAFVFGIVTLSLASVSFADAEEAVGWPPASEHVATSTGYGLWIVFFAGLTVFFVTLGAAAYALFGKAAPGPGLWQSNPGTPNSGWGAPAASGWAQVPPAVPPNPQVAPPTSYPGHGSYPQAQPQYPQQPGTGGWGAPNQPYR